MLYEIAPKIWAFCKKICYKVFQKIANLVTLYLT